MAYLRCKLYTVLQKSFLSQSESDNPAIAEKILHACKNVRVFAFYGELGAGKTTLIKAFCRFLGVKEAVSSPTFSLIHEYWTEDAPVYHLDLYRIKSEQEAFDIGCEEYFYSGAYVFIEWPQRIPNLLPSEAALLEISIVSETKRKIDLSYQAHGED